jgi:hypothetical protein
MHGHCYAVLFLAQIRGSLALELESEVDLAIEKGVRVIERAQSRRGGWWYGASNAANEDEASVTICAVQALRAAREIGVRVDASRIALGISYVRECQTAEGDVRYSLSQGRSDTSFALAAAAVATFNAAGVYRSAGALDAVDASEAHRRRLDQEALRRGIDYLRRELAEHSSHPELAVADEFFYYGNFYVAQALYQEGGSIWTRWYDTVSVHLVEPRLMVREGDAAWWRTPRGESRYGKEFATAMAVLILEIPRGYLPIFQR